MSKTLIGSIMVLIAGIAWGISGVSGQYLIQRGISVGALTSLRLLIAGGVLVAWCLIRYPHRLKQALKTPSFIRRVLLFSIFGLVANQFAYLQAIGHTNAGTATVLQYLTPVIVVIYTCLKDRIPPALLEICAIIAAIIGTYLLASHGDIHNIALNPTGLAWGIISAFTYAAYILIPVSLVKEWGSVMSVGVSMLIGGIIFSMFSGIWTQHYDIDIPMIIAFIGIIGIGTIIAYTLFIMGTAMIGAVQGSLLASIEPVASVIFTVLIFHTQFYLADIIGMIIILMAATVISLKDVINKIIIHRIK
ncbi:EamA family transporter [Alloscardovia theropitheci]|uniref:EamA family transporter n=1 Tax=Alloscardovia theropitheci TaxID=2496842 RepID=A0A4R0QZ85_9BIFI|nr:EamA family transporter [Alloscardovia theropitheci]TCD55081.1 EamA family transporter [Alloscardovia theropitheci]